MENKNNLFKKLFSIYTTYFEALGCRNLIIINFWEIICEIIFQNDLENSVFIDINWSCLSFGV